MLCISPEKQSCKSCPLSNRRAGFWDLLARMLLEVTFKLDAQPLVPHACITSLPAAHFLLSWDWHESQVLERKVRFTTSHRAGDVSDR